MRRGTAPAARAVVTRIEEQRFERVQTASGDQRAIHAAVHEAAADDLLVDAAASHDGPRVDLVTQALALEPIPARGDGGACQGTELEHFEDLPAQHRLAPRSAGTRETFVVRGYC